MPQNNRKLTVEPYRIRMDARWSLGDLYEFPRSFDQLYSFYYFFNISDEQAEYGRATEAFQAFPWLGGYSAVNFYNQLHAAIPRDDRPQILSIRYSSPGWLIISAVPAVTILISKTVHHFTTAATELNDLYNYIQRGITDRKLRKISVKHEELKLQKEHLKFIAQANELLSDGLDFRALRLLEEKTDNRLATLKILLSLFRRTRKIAEYEADHRAALPLADISTTESDSEPSEPE
jgi:hypothetical protein